MCKHTRKVSAMSACEGIHTLPEGFLSCTHQVRRDKLDRVPSALGIPGQLLQKCVTYSLRQTCAIKLLEDISIPPGSSQQKHLQECKESQR